MCGRGVVGTIGPIGVPSVPSSVPATGPAGNPFADIGWFAVLGGISSASVAVVAAVKPHVGSTNTRRDRLLRIVE
jgi:hypothetical protein